MASYVSTAANDAAVAELVASGFTEAQAKQIVANAQKPPEEVAQEAKRATAAYVSTAANEEAKQRLVAAGFTPAEAERLVASGKDVGSVVASLSAVGKERLDEVVVAQFEGQGLSKGLAQALAATGGDPKKLLALAKDPKKVEAFVRDMDARLRREGIDLGGRLKSGLGLSDADMKTAQTVYQAASAAYSVFEGVDALMSAGEGTKYIASRWDERKLGDGSFAELARALDDMAVQSKAQREAKTAAYRAAAKKIASGVAAGASLAIPAVGPAIGVAVLLVNSALESFGAYDAGSDDNDPSFEPAARDNAKKIWTEWQIVPPTFDGSYYTLATYRDVCGAIYSDLEQSNVEREWKEPFAGILFRAQNQAFGTESPLIDDLTLIDWLPLSFSDWAGGANRNAGSHWNRSGDSIWFGGYGGSFPPQLYVGGVGYPGAPLTADPFLAYVQNAKTATPEAREHLVATDGFNVAPINHLVMPRGASVQTLICDRIAATLATVMAVAYAKPVEPLVETAVGSSRQCIEVYGWNPDNAARRLRDTFLATLETARATADLAAPKYANIPVARVVQEVVTPALSDTGVLSIARRRV